jgi:hypothetical protein
VAIEGLPLARGKFIAEERDSLLARPESAEWNDEKIRWVAKDSAVVYEDMARTAIDTASLVFAHAILDGAAYAYCKVSMLAKPDDWMENLGKKQVSLAEIKDLTYEEVFMNQLKIFSEKLKENASLLRKLDLILAKCKPASGDIISGYSYSRDRIERITQDRNMAAHDYGPLHKIPNVEDDLEYLYHTNLFLHTLITTRYDLRQHVGNGKWVKFEEGLKEGFRFKPFKIGKEW